MSEMSRRKGEASTGLDAGLESEPVQAALREYLDWYPVYQESKRQFEAAKAVLLEAMREESLTRALNGQGFGASIRVGKRRDLDPEALVLMGVDADVIRQCTSEKSYEQLVIVAPGEAMGGAGPGGGYGRGRERG